MQASNSSKMIWFLNLAKSQFCPFLNDVMLVNGSTEVLVFADPNTVYMYPTYVTSTTVHNYVYQHTNQGPMALVMLLTCMEENL